MSQPVRVNSIGPYDRWMIVEDAFTAVCAAYNGGHFAPLLEADVAGYVYYAILTTLGGDAACVHLDTRLVGPNDNDKYDLVIGECIGSDEHATPVTTQLLFEPIEFLEKLAALTPRPAINLLRYHGARAPQARWPAQGVGTGRTGAGDSDAGQGDAGPRDAGGQRPPRSWAWAALMHRAFALDVVACPRCGGRLRLIAPCTTPMS